MLLHLLFCTALCSFSCKAPCAVQAKLLQALWLYMPPYVNSTANILITGISTTSSRRRRRLQSSAGTAGVTTEFDVTATAVAATASHLTSVVSSSKFVVSGACCAYLKWC